MKRRRSFMSQDQDKQQQQQQTQQQQKQQQEQPQSRYTLPMVAHLVASHFPRDVAASMRAVCTELAFDERIVATAANTQTYTGHTLLSAVCGHGNAERVARLLANENIIPDVAGNAALMAAASSMNGNSGSVMGVLLADARLGSTSADDWTHATVLAAQHNNVESLEILLSRAPAVAMQTAFMRAAIKNATQSTAYLLQRASTDPSQSINSDAALLAAVRSRSYDTANLILQCTLPLVCVSPAGTTAALLWIAACPRLGTDRVPCPSLAMLTTLLNDARTTPTVSGNAAIRGASAHGTSAAVARLLVNAQVADALRQGSFGTTFNTILADAVRTGNCATATTILTYSRVRTTCSPLLSRRALDRALLRATDDEDIALVKLLLRDGRANPNADVGSGTALDSALGYADDELAHAIVRDMRTVVSARAMACAARQGCSLTLARMLQRAQFTPSELKHALLAVCEGSNDADTAERVCALLLEAGAPAWSRQVMNGALFVDSTVSGASLCAMVLSARIEHDAKEGDDVNLERSLKDPRLGLQLVFTDTHSMRRVYQLRSFMRAAQSAKTGTASAALMWTHMAHIHGAIA